MREIQEAREQWRAIFDNHTERRSLRSAVGLRSVCWKIWLLFPDFDPATYERTLSAERSAYEALRSSFVGAPEDTSGVNLGGDPLAEDEANPWTRYRKDEELRREIVQDVERCMPDMPHFRDARVQASLREILFVYCKLNEDLGYRQGMHELVAVLLWVLGGDAVEGAAEEEEVVVEGEGEEGDDDDAVMRVVLDPRYVDHDTFSLFQVIMRAAKAWYELGEEPEGRGRPPRGRPPIVEKSRYIHEQLLMQVDPELGDHLKALDVLPQVFLIRWIRLLFGREFPLPELLEVWDSLFAEDPDLVLVDYICVAMLLRIRWPLVEADYSTALTLVLRYPSPPAPHPPATFVADATHLRDNLTLAGGRHIITQYSSREPAARPSAPAASTSVSASARAASARTKSPLGSPTRFIPGVQLDSVISGVLDRGEKWGVQRAVGRAVADVKKNVVVFQQQQSAQWAEATKEVAREEELVRRSRALSKRLKHDEERRKLLERMVGMGIDALEQESVDPAGRLKALERLREVRACLKDGTRTVDVALLETVPKVLASPLASSSSPPPPPLQQPAYKRSSLATVGVKPAVSLMGKTPGSPPGGFVGTSFKNNSDPDFLTHKPRSSLAQSSFAWMLGDDPSVKAKTGFVASGSGGGGRMGSGEMRREGGEEGREEGEEGFDLGNMGAKR